MFLDLINKKMVIWVAKTAYTVANIPHGSY